MPPYEPIAPFAPGKNAMALIGHVYLLGGRPDDAIGWLDRSIRHCEVYRNILSHVRAHLWLGQAKEQKGDKAGACAAYRARPLGQCQASQRHGRQARARAKALACLP